MYIMYIISTIFYERVLYIVRIGEKSIRIGPYMIECGSALNMHVKKNRSRIYVYFIRPSRV